MSKRLSLREALEQRVSVEAKDPDRSGSAVALILRANPDAEISRPVDVVRLLTRHGLSLRKAHDALERLAKGNIVPVVLPSVSDRHALQRDLVGLGVHTFLRPEPKPVDIPRLRTKLGLTQREFALRYFVDVGTLRNWEQNRSPQDMQTRLYLSIIERHPEVIDEVMEELAASPTP